MITIITQTNSDGTIRVCYMVHEGQFPEEAKLGIASKLLPTVDPTTTGVDAVSFATLEKDWTQWAEHDADGSFVRLDSGQVVRST